MKIVLFMAAMLAATTATAGKARKPGKPATPTCAASYKESQRAVNAENRWSYFKDTVREFTVAADGSGWVSFTLSSQRFQIAATDTALLASAKAAFEQKTVVHIAVEESQRELTPTPDPTAKASQLKWLDAKEQHPSCR